MIGLIGQLALLAALAATVGLDSTGWVVGVTYGVVLTAALTRGLSSSGANGLGPADRVTLTRATLVGAVAALTADSFGGSAPVATLVTLAGVALVLDAVDGWVARRTATESPFGARFDMEVDAFLILVLSLYVAPSTGAWVLAIGLARYLFVAAGWLLPSLRGTPPPRYWCKVVAAVQGVVLAVAAAGLFPARWTEAALLVALILLAESFGREAWWLWRHRREQSGRVRVPPGVITVPACVLVWFALVAPNELAQLTPGAFARIPLEGLLGVAALLLLPGRARRLVATLVGLVLGLVAIVKVLDMGFFAVLDRPFDPVSDWAYFAPAVGVMGDSVGGPAAKLAAGAVVLLGVGLLVLMPLAVVRLSGLAAQHRHGSLRWVTALGVAWAVCATLGVQVAPDAGIASMSAADLAYNEVSQVRDGIKDRQVFADAIGNDAYQDTPDDQLLTGLRGKDVIVAFVESYGRVAVQDSPFSPGVDAVLDDGTKRLRAAGFSSRSAFLTSPTFGAASWLAHSTLQSGLWVDSQQRYDQLLSANRLTLTDAFSRAGWRTVFDDPAITRDWPEGQDFYHFDASYDSRNVGYAGPAFSYATMPDQYTLSVFQRLELAKSDRAPVMAEIDLVSSHHPWTPLPHLVGWDELGDGSVFDGMPEQGDSPDDVFRDPDRVREVYGQSIEYSLSSLISFVETYPDPDLVLVVLGDHQPHTYVTGDGAGHDVPITVIAHDPSVMERISGWGWQEGMRPRPDAPVWPMNAFRDRFLAAYGPQPH
ncbi:CDP-alcohol phosphatidyltransferase family protein [Nocardioides sp.]|uniref:CDP-alcohol phosphatidyltransferase family protein n=1 Tax=Nocardioides sp. TaxID=35761 RepID=UPI0031FF1531